MPKRGRPSIDDRFTLKRVAELIVCGQARTVRSAIVQALPEPNEANIRRCQRKWRAEGDIWLEKVRAERAAEHRKTGPRDSIQNLHNLVQTIQLRKEEFRRIADVPKLADHLAAITTLAQKFDEMKKQARAFRDAVDNPNLRKFVENQIRQQTKLRELTNSLSGPKYLDQVKTLQERVSLALDPLGKLKTKSKP